MHRAEPTPPRRTAPWPVPVVISPAAPTVWHASIRSFKQRLVAGALERADGNRTHAARALGLQRTYLQRLIRELEVHVPRRRVRRAS